MQAKTSVKPIQFRQSWKKLFWLFWLKNILSFLPHSISSSGWNRLFWFSWQIPVRDYYVLSGSLRLSDLKRRLGFWVIQKIYSRIHYLSLSYPFFLSRVHATLHPALSARWSVRHIYFFGVFGSLWSYSSSPNALKNGPCPLAGLGKPCIRPC